MTIIILYSTFSNFGTLIYLETNLPRLRGEKKYKEYRNLSKQILSITFVTSLMFSMLFLVYTLNYTNFTLTNSKYLLFLLPLYVITSQLTAYYLTIERTQNNFIYLSKFQLLSSLILNLSNICLSALYGLNGYLMSLLFNSALQFSILYKRNKPNQIFSFIKLADAKKILFKSITLMISGLTFITFKSIDSFVIMNLYGLQTLGTYSLAILGATILYSLTNSIAVVLFPKIQETIGQKKEITLPEYTNNAMIAISFILPIVMYPLHCLIHYITIFHISNYLPGLEYFDIILLSSFFYSALNLIINIYTSRNKIFRVIIINLIHILIALALTFLSFKFFKTTNAVVLSIALAQILYFITISIDSLKFINKKTKIFSHMVNVIKPFTLLLVIGGLCNYSIASYEFKAIILKIIIFMLFYIIAALKINPELKLLLYKLKI